MPGTMRHGTRRRYSAPRARVHPVYVVAAPRTGLTAGSLHQGTARWVARLAEVVAAAAAIPDPLFVERTLAPIDAARAGLPIPRLTPALLHQAQASDAAEEISESSYRADPTPDHLRRWLRDLERQRADSLLLILAIRQELASHA